MHYGIIHSNTNEIISTAVIPFINNCSIPKKYTIAIPGDLFLADTSEDRKDCGKGIEIDGLNNHKVVGGLHTIHIRDKKSLFVPFYKALFTRSSTFHKFAYKYSEGIKVFSLKPSLFKFLDFYYPEKLEQQKIVDLFVDIDTKIALVEQKIETLKKYKEGLILKVLKPTVENWKNGSVNGIKLSSFLIPYKELATTDNYVHATLSKEGVSDKTERYNRDFLVKDVDKKYRLTAEGDLVYNPANLKFGVICINRFETCVISPIYETFKVRNIDRDLLESIVTSKSFIRYALKFEEGTVYERRAVSVEDFLKIKIYVDNNNLDNISVILKVIQRKIDILNHLEAQCTKLKSYLLNKMFI